MKKCQICHKLKDVTEFGANKSKLDGKQPYCKLCSKNKDKKHYINSPTRKQNIRKNSKYRNTRAKEYILEYLLQHPCIDCNESDPCVLQFDHLENKKYDMSTLIAWGASNKTLKEEIEKCQVRCANCHVRKTANQFGWWKRTTITSNQIG